MSQKLDALIQKTNKVTMTSDDRERQRQSFAYGNTKIENDKITRQIVEDAAARLGKKRDAGGKR